jgi:hypothetical protein
VDNERDLYIDNRESTLGKSWVTDLWVKVIKKAIDDLVLYTRISKNGGKLSEEELLYANTAYGFLFDPEYTIQIGNMELTTAELISHWDIEDIDKWREEIRKKIKELVNSRKK